MTKLLKRVTHLLKGVSTTEGECPYNCFQDFFPSSLEHFITCVNAAYYRFLKKTFQIFYSLTPKSHSTNKVQSASYPTTILLSNYNSGNMEKIANGRQLNLTSVFLFFVLDFYDLIFILFFSFFPAALNYLQLREVFVNCK